MFDRSPHRAGHALPRRRVDERALTELVELQIAAGVDGVVPCGSTGEAATLSHAEHQRVVEVVVAAARGRVQVLAGTGSNSTVEAIQLTQHAKDAGADGALLISPYYNRPTQDGIVAHYAEIARQTSFPLVVYNIPGRTGSNILPSTIARLAEVDQIVGVKESCGDLNQIAHVIASVPDSFAVLSGDDWATLPMLALGGSGVISTTRERRAWRSRRSRARLPRRRHRTRALGPLPAACRSSTRSSARPTRFP